jgi:aldehyde dehydrogenase (NAD+)
VIGGGWTDSASGEFFETDNLYTGKPWALIPRCAADDVDRASGAECGDGWFVEPTIFGGVDNAMRIAQEEVFGPVLSIIPFRDEEEALAIGNDVVYRLAAGVWTQSMRRALMMADRLQAGTVWVNTYRAVSYLSPFGGYKRSGIGRESGQEMLKEYLQVKSVWISTASEVPNPFVQR